MCKYEDFNNPNDDSSVKLYLDLVILIEELFLVNALPSPGLIFNKLKEATKRHKRSKSMTSCSLR